MSFREKSAWAMGLLTLLAGVWYIWTLLGLPVASSMEARMGPLVLYVMVMVAGSIVIQAVLAIRAPAEAQSRADERERPLIDRAGRWSGAALGLMVVTGSLEYVVLGQGDRLFAWVMGGMIVSQIVEYGAQVVLFRRGY